MDKIAGVNFYNSVPKLSQAADNQKIAFCGNEEKKTPKFLTTEKLLGLGALAALGIAAVMLHKSNAAKKAAKKTFENVENLQKSANAELAAKRSENPNKIIDYVEQLKIDETGAKHAKIQTEYELMQTKYNLMADRRETLAKRSSLTDDMIMRVEKLKKAERNSLEHAKRQYEYDNFHMYKSNREDALDPLSYTFDNNLSTTHDIFPNHPFIESVKGIADKNHNKKAFVMKIKNNENVDSFKFIHLKSNHTKGYKKGFIKVNFKDGTSKILGKYDFTNVQSQKGYDDILDSVIIPQIQKYVPEITKYPEEYIKYMFRN